MIAYLDASVLLRILLGQKDQLSSFSEISLGVSSALSRVECLRTLDRMRATGSLSQEEGAAHRAAVYRIFEAIEVVELFPEVLERASSPFPTVLGTLDAIHLSTALLWRAQNSQDLALATHDHALGRAGKALGLDVEGTW